MPHYAKWDRAPHYPYECVICTHEANPDNPLVEAGRVIEDYGDVYVCKSCIHSLAHYLEIPQTAEREANKRVEELSKEVNEVPNIIERLVNGIRELSISTSADLLAISTPVILVDDKKSEQGDDSTNETELGHNSSTESVSKSVVNEGPDSVPASAGSKRATNTSTRKSTVSNG